MKKIQVKIDDIQDIRLINDEHICRTAKTEDKNCMDCGNCTECHQCDECKPTTQSEAIEELNLSIFNHQPSWNSRTESKINELVKAHNKRNK